jgi:hypothetical protein
MVDLLTVRKKRAKTVTTQANFCIRISNGAALTLLLNVNPDKESQCGFEPIIRIKQTIKENLCYQQ